MILWNHHLCLVLRHFHKPRIPIKVLGPAPHYPQLLADTNVLSVSMNFPILEVASFTYYNVLKFIHILPCVSVYSFFKWVICTYTTFFVYICISWWTFRLVFAFWLLWIVLWTSEFKCLNNCFQFFGTHLGRLLHHLVTLCLTVWRNTTLFSRVFTILHFYKQYTKFPVFLHHCQHSFSFS
jgi:hypothetical protein